MPDECTGSQKFAVHTRKKFVHDWNILMDNSYNFISKLPSLHHKGIAPSCLPCLDLNFALPAPCLGYTLPIARPGAPQAGDPPGAPGRRGTILWGDAAINLRISISSGGDAAIYPLGACYTPIGRAILLWGRCCYKFRNTYPGALFCYKPIKMRG